MVDETTVEPKGEKNSRPIVGKRSTGMGQNSRNPHQRRLSTLDRKPRLRGSKHANTLKNKFGADLGSCCKNDRFGR